MPRPAPAEHPHDRQRLVAARASPPPTGAARRRTSSCSASTARPGRPRTSCAPTRSARRRPPSATTASSAPSSTCSPSPRRSAPASRSSTPRAASSAPRSRTTCASACIANGYELVNTPHITKGHLFETSQHLNWYRDGMFPPMHLDEERDADGNITTAGPGLLPQAHELPDAQPDLPRPRAQLPRAAAAPGRVRHRVPLREVRHPAGPHARARPDPGRRAHLRRRRTR